MPIPKSSWLVRVTPWGRNSDMEQQPGRSPELPVLVRPSAKAPGGVGASPGHRDTGKPGSCPEQKHSGCWEQLLVCLFRPMLSKGLSSHFGQVGSRPEKHCELSKVTQQRQASSYTSCSSSPGPFPLAPLCDLATVGSTGRENGISQKKPGRRQGQ